MWRPNRLKQMPPIPTWPDRPGPRIMTLAGNNLTIDVRARKTASSLARTGYAVIALGIDELGEAPESEQRDGALIWRIQPPADPRITSRVLRWSRAEIRESLRYRSEIVRARLAVSRRYLSERIRRADAPSPGSLLWGRVRIMYLRVSFAVSFGAYKYLARPPRLAMLPGRWERDLPHLHRYEHSLGPIIDALQPDLIHVHDVFHIGVAVRAGQRALEAGRSLRVVYDAHEYVAGLPIDARRRKAYQDLEREYIGQVDAVVTVSPGLAGLLLQDYGLAARVVTNAPDASTAETTTPLRHVVGIPEDHRIAVYVGGIAPHRGAEMLIEAMNSVPPDVHLVFVAASGSSYIEGLVALAERTGVGNRVHLAPYVAPEAVVSYIQSADVSIIPLSRAIPNYEIALPNKLFQSVQAGVPVVVSDNPEMGEYVQRTGIGEVFAGGNEADLVRALTKVLENPDPYRSALSDRDLQRTTSWGEQSQVLTDLYRSLGVGPEPGR